MLTRRIILPLILIPFVTAFEHVRLNKNDSMLLVVDHQVGLFNVVRDATPEEFRNNMLAHASIGKLFNLPTILTTSGETGPNGPIPHEILDMHPTAPLIKRRGEINAWDNAEFREAVKATGKKQVIIAAITTDVCATLLALSLVQEGYTVFHNAEASGAASERIAINANNRMGRAGVQIMSMMSIVSDLMRDYTATPGAKDVLPFFDQFWPTRGYVIRSHVAAHSNTSVIFPGELL